MEAKETKDDSSDDSANEADEREEAKTETGEGAKAPLPPKVATALERARAAARADHAQKSGRWLVVIPLGIGALMLSLLMPRATPPDGIPLPRTDYRVPAAVARAEDQLAAEAEQNRLAGDILAVGTAIRDLNVAAEDNNQPGALEARRRIDTYVVDAVRRGGEQELIRLRAVQTRVFLDTVDAWERGEQPKDFIAAGGGFVKRMEEAGWVKDHHLLMNETERRVAFKTVWNGVTHLDREHYSLTLDEERALYAFYIQHPHVGESARLGIERMSRNATSPEACAKVQSEVRREESLWLVDKIKRFAAIDPKYPGMYALGVAYWQGGRQDLAVDAFNTFIDQHPDGDYALRAKNHLKAAVIGK